MAVVLPTVPKKPWMSKTIWVNMILAMVAIISAWVPQVGTIVSPETVAMVMAMINMILRLVTKDALVLW